MKSERPLGPYIASALLVAGIVIAVLSIVARAFDWSPLGLLLAGAVVGALFGSLITTRIERSK